nr:hypothetical protein [Pseudomonadota bacterium]
MTKHKHILACLLLAGTAACTGASASGTPEEAYARGVQAFEAGQPRTARIEFMNALQANPNDRRARVMQARTYLALGDGVAAESEVRRAREAGAADAETRHLVAHALLLQNQPQRAIEESEGAAPEHAAYAARVRGRAYMALDDNARAAQE